MRVLLVLTAIAILAVPSPIQAVGGQQPNARTRRQDVPENSPAEHGLAVPPARSVEPALGVAADGFDTREAVLETPWFTFYSHFGFNLYDAVLTSATARRAKRADPIQDGDCFASLVQEQRSAWDAAVGYYAEIVATTSDFSRERAIVRAHLTGVEIALDDDDRRDLGLAVLFLRAALSRPPASPTSRSPTRSSAATGRFSAGRWSSTGSRSSAARPAAKRRRAA